MKMMYMAFAVALFSAMSACGQNLSDGKGDFAMSVYQQVAKEKDNGNFVFSPMSVSLALRMTAAGAQGKTLDEMLNVLGGRKTTLNHDTEKLMESIEGDGPCGAMIANAIWVQKGHGLQSRFVDTLKNYYRADCNESDFIKASARKKAISSINRYVSAKTKGKIGKLVDGNVIGEATRMVLANAIYFKCDWLNPFKPSNTRERMFHSIGGDSASSMFMAQTDNFMYFEDVDCQAVSLPYADGRYQMLVVLPSEKMFRRVEQRLTSVYVANLLSNMGDERVDLTLPKFKIETDVDFTEILKSMGMADAFSPFADFSGMSKSNDLQISKVLHKAVIEVDEQGAEVASATAVAMVMKSVFRPEAKSFVADRPFVYFIVDSATQTILFAGRYVSAN